MGTTTVYHFNFRMRIVFIAFIAAVLLTYPFNLPLLSRGLSIFIAVIILSVPSFYHFIIVDGNLKKYFLYLAVWEVSLANIKSIVAIDRIDIDKPTLIEIGKVDKNIYYLIMNDGTKMKIGNCHYVDVQKQTVIRALQKLTNKKIEHQRKYIIFQ